MRLFLASQDFGNYVDRLSAMVGKNRKTLVVTNARDYSVDKGVEAQKSYLRQMILIFMNWICESILASKKS